jgi:hypothetical protein
MQQNDKDITRAIRGCISIGKGSITKLCLNGKCLHEKISWDRYCILDCYYGGLVCDNKLIVRFTKDDTWSIERMDNHGVVLNSIDTSKIEGNVEEIKERTAKNNNVLNI